MTENVVVFCDVELLKYLVVNKNEKGFNIIDVYACAFYLCGTGVKGTDRWLF